jgi:hypothetical protein
LSTPQATAKKASTAAAKPPTDVAAELEVARLPHQESGKGGRADEIRKIVVRARCRLTAHHLSAGTFFRRTSGDSGEAEEQDQAHEEALRCGQQAGLRQLGAQESGKRGA